MARTAKAPRIAPRNSVTNGNAGILALTRALQINLDVARNMISASFATLQAFLLCAEHMQRTNAEAINDLSNVVTAAVEQAEYATNLPEFIEAHRSLATGHVMRAAQYFGALVGRLSEVEAGLIQQAYAAAAARSNALVHDVESQWRGSGANGAPAPFGEAQGTLATLMQQWLQLMTPLPAPHPARGRPTAGRAR